MIEALQMQLEEEKEARLELEREVEDLKRASATQLEMSHREWKRKKLRLPLFKYRILEEETTEKIHENKW